MGTLRFILALLVLISHLGMTCYGLNPGVIAVVVFYLLAGHVVARLWQQWQSQPRALLHFYLDRSWRIFPQYLTAVVLAAGLWYGGAQSPFIAAAPNIRDWLANLGVIPLNFYMYTGQDRFTLIPPAWSLGAELQFYLLAPFLLAQTRPRLLICFALSLVVFVAAQMQWLHTDHYGYRLLPGVLFIFLTGALQERSRQQKTLRPSLFGLWGFSVLYLLYLLVQGPYRPYNREVALGLTLAMPLLALLSRQTASVADKHLGNLSYGVFLYHFPVFWLLGLNPPVTALADRIIAIALTLVVAAAGHHLIERPLWRRYRSDRSRADSRQQSASNT